MPDASELQGRLDEIDSLIAELSTERAGVASALASAPAAPPVGEAESPGGPLDPTVAAPAAQDSTPSDSPVASTESPTPSDTSPPSPSAPPVESPVPEEESRKLS